MRKFITGRDSSAGIATRDGLDDSGNESRWGGTRFSAPVQPGPGVYPASCTMSTGSFPGVKRPGRGADYPPPSKCRGHERVELYLYSPSGPSWPVIGWTFTFMKKYKVDQFDLLRGSVFCWPPSVLKTPQIILGTRTTSWYTLDWALDLLYLHPLCTGSEKATDREVPIVITSSTCERIWGWGSSRNILFENIFIPKTLWNSFPPPHIL